MVNYSDSLVVIVTEWAAMQMDEVEVFYSDIDACWVLGIRCGCCGTMYEEELGAAEEKIRNERNVLCIRCDAEAE